ncbi:Netrin-1 [Schistosoma japonicum]|nr:Netrin-1 [Schistosoma japonicum]
MELLFYLLFIIQFMNEVNNSLHEEQYEFNEKFNHLSHSKSNKKTLKKQNNFYHINRNLERLKRTFLVDINSHSSSCQSGSQSFQCSPPFKDISRGVTVHATSTCGEHQPQSLCRSSTDCQLCSVNSTEWKFSSDYLTDRHNINNQTCWASGHIQPGEVVNLTISLGKRFEVYYISLQPCSIGSMPHSIAIYKSSDFGRTWRPWHYFSTDCYRAFGLPTSNEHSIHITSANLQEVLCVALQPRESYYNHQGRKVRSMNNYIFNKPNVTNNFGGIGVPSDWVIAFSTTLGRPVTRPWSPALIDWMTMTDVRISLMNFHQNNEPEYRTKRTAHQNQLPHYSKLKHSSQNINRLPLFQSNYFYENLNKHQPKRTRSSRDGHSGNELARQEINHTNMMQNQNYLSVLTKQPLNATVSPEVLSEIDFYAFADIAIGGRCKCNGHASECVLSSNGKLTCACEHHTSGDDCEYCKPGYMDRPWDRATPQDANICKKCDCNLHSNECRFSNSLYLLSNRVSGGVCENCQHNTVGRNCHQCAEGYYRDWTKPISHENVCLPCRCHPIGSIVRHDCDRRSGQCRCKQGVAGLTCDRCQDGYHQTRSPLNPCTKDFTSRAVALAHTPGDINCPPCSTNKERIKLKKFCRKDAVFQASFKSRELHGNMARFEMYITQIWRINKEFLKGSSSIYWPASKSFIDFERYDHDEYDEEIQRKSNELVPVWVRLNELKCKCPYIELGISYLIVTDFESFTNKVRNELLFSIKTAILPWRSSWKRRLIRFRRRENRGACEKFREPTKLLSVFRPKQALEIPTAQREWYSTVNSQIPSFNHEKPSYSLSLRPYSNRRDYRIS